MVVTMLNAEDALLRIEQITPRISTSAHVVRASGCARGAYIAAASPEAPPHSSLRALEVAEDPPPTTSVRVVILHCPTIKPLDEAAIIEAVRYKHWLVVVAENHSVVGGFGEAVASSLIRNGVQLARLKLAGTSRSVRRCSRAANVA